MEKAPSAKQEKIERIEFLESEIKDLRKQLENFELDPDDYSEQFDDFLNEEGDAIKICGCFYSRSEILKEVDPINYRCSLNDFIDAIDLEDTEEYKNLEDKLSELEDELENLISEEE